MLTDCLDDSPSRWDRCAKLMDSVMNFILPYMEGIYNIATDPQKRAFWWTVYGWEYNYLCNAT